MSDSYHSALVCRRGHIESEAVEIRLEPDDPARGRFGEGAAVLPMRCGRCGAILLRSCPSCEQRIRGAYRGFGSAAYQPPDFCDRCGAAMPWASRQARFFELENILDEATRLQVLEELEALRESQADDETAVRRWEVIHSLAPGLIATGQKIIETVVSAAVKAQLGIH